MRPLASWTNHVAASGTMEVSRAIDELRQQGKKIISLSVGEPDFPTPPHIVEAAVRSLRHGDTHYAPPQGIEEFREAISQRFREKNGVECTADDVLVTPAKHAIFMALATLVDRDDEVLIPDPSWVSYAPQTVFLGGKSVLVPFGERFEVDEEALKNAITPRSKVYVLNNPSNPLGKVFSENELRIIRDLAVDHDLYVVADEVYERLVYEGKHVSIASLPGMWERTVTVCGLSKSYAMTGWRVGWAIGPREIISPMLKIQEHTITCLPRFAQEAGIAALRGSQSVVREMREEFRKRRDLVLSLLENIPGINVNRPQGAFYVFPSYDLPTPSVEFAKDLLREEQVAVTPGSAFGPRGEGHFRISYASSEEEIREGLLGIKRFMERRL